MLESEKWRYGEHSANNYVRFLWIDVEIRNDFKGLVKLRRSRISHTVNRLHGRVVLQVSALDAQLYFTIWMLLTHSSGYCETAHLLRTTEE